jgi:putative mRNA 3-end processing factor
MGPINKISIWSKKVVQSGAEQVYTIHGFVEEFASHLRKMGISAQPLRENSLDDFI